MKKIKILVCIHKNTPCLKNKVYMPIQLGRSLVDFDLGFRTDLLGDNIGEKNFLYSEFTGLYWAWKNLKNLDYIGIAHYRRYFFLNDYSRLKRETIIIDEKELFQIDFSTDILNQYLSKFDIILPYKKIFTTSVWNVMCKMHGKCEMEIMELTLKKMYPEYAKSFDKFVKKSNRLEMYAIFITRWEIFDNYCEWIFSILFQIENQINPSNNSLHAERKIGFLAEILAAVYFNHNNLKVKNLPVAWVNTSENNKSWIRYHGSNIKSNLRFYLNL